MEAWHFRGDEALPLCLRPSSEPLQLGAELERLGEEQDSGATASPDELHLMNIGMTLQCIILRNAVCLRSCTIRRPRLGASPT
mmetsp:Transcript_17792/g.40074  ORF Transcript_17792/g.40074 Transcript_17792/m.40074 type:complete len:83 (+) Transcript_17792:159-407(+)